MSLNWHTTGSHLHQVLCPLCRCLQVYFNCRFPLINVLSFWSSLLRAVVVHCRFVQALKHTRVCLAAVAALKTAALTVKACWYQFICVEYVHIHAHAFRNPWIFQGVSASAVFGAKIVQWVTGLMEGPSSQTVRAQAMRIRAATRRRLHGSCIMWQRCQVHVWTN